MSKRRKRLFPKRFSASVVNTPRIDSNKAAAYNAQRSKATVGPRHDTEHKLGGSWNQEVPETRHRRVWDRNKRVWMTMPTYKLEVEKTRDELVVIEKAGLITLYKIWQDQMRDQGVSEYHCRVLERIGDSFKVMLFFSGDKFLFVQEYKNVRRYSKEYTGLLEYAMSVHLRGEYAWIAKEEF